MATDPQSRSLLVTVDEIVPDHDSIPLATMVTDTGDIITAPLALLPEGTRAGDVLSIHFEQQPDERQVRRDHIAELQRRLFGGS